MNNTTPSAAAYPNFTLSQKWSKISIVTTSIVSPAEEVCITKMWLNAWKEFIKPVKSKKKIIGIRRGTVIFINVCHLEAPSTFAASYKSEGMMESPANKIIA